MKVAFLTSECTPLAKAGGLADVSASLPKSLKSLGIDICIFLPFYRHVKKNARFIEDTGKRIRIKLGNRSFNVNIRETENYGVRVYLIENDEFFDRDYLYSTPYGDYPDNGYRFAFFSLASLEAMKALMFKPDIIHVNDWETSIVPVYLAHNYYYDNFFSETGTVLTIHNLAYQGIFPKELLPEINLDYSLFHINGLEFYGNINFLKGGIIFSDYVNTVSPTYAEEIKTEKYGYGLQGVLRLKGEKLVGILNGIDYEEWNPEKDPRIYKNYGIDNIEDKYINKKELMRELGLVDGEKRILAGVISRLAEQKGIDLIHQAAGDLINSGVSLVILGMGEKRYEDLCIHLERIYEGYVKTIIAFDEVLSARIYAGSDIFLMPSRYEPCGLGQMIALRYGTVPVVRKTGGLKDTIQEFDPDTLSGNGFLFEEFLPNELFKAVSRAIDIYSKKDLWMNLVKNCMECDYSWEASAKKYIELYEKTLEERRIKNEKGYTS